MDRPQYPGSPWKPWRRTKLRIYCNMPECRGRQYRVLHRDGLYKCGGCGRLVKVVT
jgi:hypothetical protein